jgi:predicted outer membrane repeat protein
MINAAVTGDTVWVADGTYAGTGNKNLSWSGKHITVRSVNGANNCIIDCENSGRGFYFNSTGQTAADRIEGFTIRNGYVAGDWPCNSGGGICYYSYSSSSITNCTISGNSAAYGGGIYCHWDSSPSIQTAQLQAIPTMEYIVLAAVHLLTTTMFGTIVQGITTTSLLGT